jgi:16S rRNA (guanine966-N2)-methyltransferase
MLNIITGEFKGRKLAFPKDNPGVRPTSSRTRHAIFNILNSYMDLRGITMLDLFSGSGALGLEALSRGASHITFVDLNPTFVIQNVTALKVEDRVTILRQDATVARIPNTVDLILADPPYSKGFATKLLADPARYGHSGSVWMVETEAEWQPVYDSTKLELLSTRTQGAQALHLFKQL